MSSTSQEATVATQEYDEVEKYLDSPCEPIITNPLTFWRDNKNKYQKLAIVAQKVLSIPASSAPVERLFSIAGKVVRPDRCRLTDERFTKMMFIRCNNNV